MPYKSIILIEKNKNIQYNVALQVGKISCQNNSQYCWLGEPLCIFAFMYILLFVYTNHEKGKILHIKHVFDSMIFHNVGRKDASNVNLASLMSSVFLFLTLW